jgi:hypothetical protein
MLTETIRSVDGLCTERGIDAKQLAESSGVDEKRVRAIVQDRWTPSREDRDCIAAVFGVDRYQVAWGHRALVEPLSGWVST